MRMLRNKVSLVAMLLIIAAIGSVRLSRPQWEKNEILTWDVFGYYLYLPATFIDHDIKLEKQEWLDSLMQNYPSTPVLYQALPGPKGNKVILYTTGMSMLYSPFFFTANTLAEPLGYKKDGLSMPYQLAIALGCLLYTIIGLIFARKILLRFFNDRLAAGLLLILAFGTNYFHLTALEGIMPHNSVFMLYTLIVWCTIRWHEDHKALHAFLLGAFMALAILARGSEIVCLFIPLLWGIKDRQSLRAKWKMILRYKRHVVLLGTAMFIVALPQLLYWKYAAGHWIYDSYKDAGFSFDHPHLLDVLLSYKKGWLVYTPVMIFSLIGFIFLYRYRRDIFWAALIFFLLNFYIVSSWDVWWYAASFGQRALMQSYAVMILPLGAFFYRMNRTGIFAKVIVYTVTVLFAALNLFQTWQFGQGIIDLERMTRSYYWAVFLKTSVTAEERELLEPDWGWSLEEMMKHKVFDHRVLRKIDFEAANAKIENRVDTLAHSEKYSFRLDSTAIFSPRIDTLFGDITNKHYVWLRATAYVYSEVSFQENPSTLSISAVRGNKTLKYAGADDERLPIPLVAGKWNKVTLDYLTPYIIRKGDKLMIQVWHRGKHPVWIDDMTVEMYEPKYDID
jgi:hypothetical protein